MSEWWATGVRFACQGSGRCCTARDGYGYVYVDLEDRRRLAEALSMSTSAFTRAHCEQNDYGDWYLSGPESDCRFLEGRQCRVYAGRPTQCRTWPFWPENMDPEVWDTEVAPFCAGVGKGERVPGEEIQRTLRVHQETP